MLRLIVQSLLCLLLLLATRDAWAVEPEVIELEEEPAADSGSAASKAAKAKKKKRKKKVPVEEVVVEEIEPEPEPEPPPRKRKRRSDEPPPREEILDPGGLECSPAVTEVETRRPIPISCGVTREGVSRIEVRYKAPGKRKFTRLVLNKAGDEWTGEIPCSVTARSGPMSLQFNARGAGDKVVARIDTVTIQLVESTEELPPSLPGQQAPMRCYDSSECPPEFKGTPACPGTKPSATASKSWGASCAASSECQSGLACINGTCDQAPKCESTSDCPTGGECSDGVCQFPDPEELASRLSDPKFNWIGIHFGVDVMLARKAVGVCGNDSEDSNDYACFRGGDPYDGDPNENFSGDVDGGFRMATMRILLSYERWILSRLALGARVGFAFGGAPKDFTPLHLEARVLYSMRKDPLYKRFRPYLGLAGGLAQADPKSTATVIDCRNADAECLTATREDFQNNSFGAQALKLDAYRRGSKLFFGPTLGFFYALANDQAISFNVNVMFPDLVIEPAIGYVIGL